MSEADQDKLKKDKKPVHNKLGLLNLGSGETTIIDDVESFAFSRDGGFLAMDHYAPAPPAGSREGSGGGGAGSDADEEKPGHPGHRDETSPPARTCLSATSPNSPGRTPSSAT